MSSYDGTQFARESDQREHAGPTILVVEDDRPLADLLRDVLSAHGYQVVTANDGERGLARLEAGGIDLVLLDLMLPGVDGLEVCRQARSRLPDGEPYLPIIMLTALARVSEQQAGFQAGSDDYVTKPFDVETLLARIEVWLRLRQHSQALIAARRAAERQTLIAQADAVRITARELADRWPAPAWDTPPAAGRALDETWRKAAIADQPDSPDWVPALVASLYAGGATDLRATTKPVWIVATAPSGSIVQLVWSPDEAGFYVSRLTVEAGAAEPIGLFPEPDGAVACALGA